MHFLKLDKLLPIESEKDLYVFWLTCLAFRKSHRHIERELANYVFLKSNDTRKLVSFDSVMDDITYEFAALEAPGVSPNENVDPSDYANSQWIRLENKVNKDYMHLVDIHKF